MVFLEESAKSLLGVHLILAAATLYGLSAAFYFLYFKKEVIWRKVNLNVIIGGLGYLATWVLGLLIYPVFRINVRAEDFDVNRPEATALFEIKEHLGSLGLFAVLALLILVLIVKRENISRSSKVLYGQLLTFVILITLFKAVAGLILTAWHSI